MQAGAISLLPDRCVPAGRRERGARGAAARREVRDPGLSARRRRRAVRVRAAPLDVRLRLRERLAGEPHRRVRRSPARALPRPGRHSRRPLHAADGPRLQHHDARREPRGVSRIPTVPRGRASLARPPSPRADERDRDATRTTMRAAVLVDVARIEVRDVPVQRPAPHEVLVRVEAVGLCGTDLHIVAGHANYNTDDHGRVLPLAGRAADPRARDRGRDRGGRAAPCPTSRRATA